MNSSGIGDRPDAPRIVDVRRNALDDGPGIRSVVFFKGCPLRCAWCQNPETLSPRAELQRVADRCNGCRACEPVCTRGAARPALVRQPGGTCDSCGACVEACATAARRVAGEYWDLDALAELLLRDEPFYRHSGGGVTLSGGEPTLFSRFSGELASRLASAGAHVLLQTCGHFDWRDFERWLLPHLSTVYFDLKLADRNAHRRHTGRGNSRIRDNLRRLADAGVDEILPRVPLVPGITDSRDNLGALATYLTELGLPRVALLPYNPLWIPKREALGLDMPYDRQEWMAAQDVDRCADVFRRAGLTVVA